MNSTERMIRTLGGGALGAGLAAASGALGAAALSRSGYWLKYYLRQKVLALAVLLLRIQIPNLA